jgi:hypothetical protein
MQFEKDKPYTCVRLANMFWSDLGFGSKEFKGNLTWLKNMNSKLSKDGLLVITDLKITLQKVSDSEFKII